MEKRVLVMAEYGVGLPLWDRTPGGGPLDQDDLGLSAELVTRLMEWNAVWVDHRPEEPRTWSSAQEYEWHQTGYRLAWQLQSELPEVEVLVRGERGQEVALADAFDRRNRA